MIFAITCENGQVFQHFGHTPGFMVYGEQGGQIMAKAPISSGTAGHSALADVLAANGVSVLICGGIGEGARNALAKKGIRVISGISGDVDERALDFLAGALQEDLEAGTCHHHDHEEGHQCGSCSGPCHDGE